MMADTTWSSLFNIQLKTRALRSFQTIHVVRITMESKPFLADRSLCFREVGNMSQVDSRSLSFQDLWYTVSRQVTARFMVWVLRKGEARARAERRRIHCSWFSQLIYKMKFWWLILSFHFGVGARALTGAYLAPPLLRTTSIINFRQYTSDYYPAGFFSLSLAPCA